jgi:hypothetical protein
MAEKRRADGQMSGLAGEFFVAAELLKRDIQTSVTFGSAKSIDLLAHRSDPEDTFIVQVKSLRAGGDYFPISRDKINRLHIYVFVLLNKPGVQARYFIVPGSELCDRRDNVGEWLDDPKMPGIRSRDLAEFENNWALFDYPA